LSLWIPAALMCAEAGMPAVGHFPDRSLGRDDLRSVQADRLGAAGSGCCPPRSSSTSVERGPTRPCSTGRGSTVGTVGPLSTQANRRVWTVLVRVIHAAVSLTAH